VRNGSTKFIKLDKTAQPTATVTSEETKKFEQTAKIQEIQQVTDSKMMQVVREESLEAQLQPDFTAVKQNRHF